MRFLPLLILSAICFCPLAAFGQAASQPALPIAPLAPLASTVQGPPEPEDFIPEGQYTDYARIAQDFLRSQPDSPAAPRVALELLINAAEVQDQGTVLRMRKLLLAEYPDSAVSHFVITTLFRDGRDFAATMAEIAAEHFVTLPVDFPPKFDQAMKLGVSRFGASALGEGPSLEWTFVLCRLAGDQRLAEAAGQLLAAAGPAGDQWRQAVLIFLDGKSAPLDKLAKLHALTDRGAAAIFEGFLLSRLSPDERSSAVAQEIDADDDLYNGNLAAAVPILTKLNSNDTRLMFWRAWAAGATGDTSADGMLKDLASSHSDDPWGKQAADLEPALAGVDSSLSKNVDAALNASRGLQNNLDLLQGTADFTRPDGVHVQLYVGYSAGKVLDISGSSDGNPVFTYRATDQEAWLFLKGDSSIEHFKKPVLLYSPRLGLVRFGNGYTLRADLTHFTYSFDELATDLGAMLGSDIITTQPGLEDMMRNLIRQGILPMPPAANADGSVVYTWASPAVSTPDSRKISFTVDSTGAIVGCQFGDVHVTAIKYGRAGAFALSEPQMPSLPMKEMGQMESSSLQQALPVFFGLLYPPPPPPSTEPSTLPTTQQ